MLVSLGLDFRRARLEIRERFHLEDDEARRVAADLGRRGAAEVAIARTCNRTEIYCWWDAEEAAHSGAAARAIARAWVGRDGADAETLVACARERRGPDVVRHLFRVAAGLESQILGDIHILGQLRRAFREAVAERSIGSYLHRLFETGLRVGKQVKRGTRLQSARHSVGSEAARRAAEASGRLTGRRCVVLGCGKSGTHAARGLVALGATDVVVVNRTQERAEKLARELGARAAGLSELYALLSGADVLIVATGAPEPVVRAADLAAARRGATGALVVVDVSVPRNVETSAAALAGVELIDLDTLRPEAAAVERGRLEAVPEAEALVERGVAEFAAWLELEAASRALRPLHAALREICRREVAFLAGASPSAERTADRIVAGLMAHPMTALRGASARGEAVARAAALGRLFAGGEAVPLVPASSRQPHGRSRSVSPTRALRPSGKPAPIRPGAVPIVSPNRRDGMTMEIDTSSATLGE